MIFEFLKHMRAARFIFLSIFIFFVLFLTSPVKGFAQTTQLPDLNTAPGIPQNLHTMTQTVLLEVASAISCQISGVDPTQPDQRCLTKDPKTGMITYAENTGGLIGFSGNMISALYTPPARTSDFLQYTASNFGVVKHVYAQGTGFSSISPLMNLWKTFRDITFLILLVLFIFIGIAIMLRVKVDQRTVMSIENQLPNIIITILLITFSYAMAGFLIDFMWVTIYLVTNVITSANQDGATVALVNNFIFTPPLGFANEIMTDPSWGAGGLLDMAWIGASGIFGITNKLFPPASVDKYFISAVPGLSVVNTLTSGQCNWWDFGCLVSTTVQSYVGSVMSMLGVLVSFTLGIIGFLVLIIALLVALFRLWIVLLTSYVYILLDIVLAPFFILGGLFPGSPVNFEAWLRDMLANLLAFPTTIAMFLLGKVFMDTFAGNNNTLFVPPLIGNPNDQKVFAALLGIAIVLMTPVVLTMMRELLKAPTFKYAAEAFRSAGAGGEVVGGMAKTGAGAAQAYQHGTVPVGAGQEGLKHYIMGKLSSGGH